MLPEPPNLAFDLNPPISKLSFGAFSFRVAFLLLWILLAEVSGQDRTDWRLHVAIGSHSVALPIVEPIKLPLQAVGTLGLTRPYAQPPWSQSWELSGYRHTHAGGGLLLSSSLEYGLKAGRWGLKPSLGVGYLHSFSSRPSYRQDPDGSYVLSRDWGRPQAMIGFGVAGSVQWGQWAPFLRYRWWGQLPYSPSNWLFPHAFLQIGLSYALFRP